MAAIASGAEVFIPGVGFRPADGALTLARPVETSRNGVGLWLGRVISAGRTDLVCAFSGVDWPAEEEPVARGVCPIPWWRDFRLELRDASGRAYASERLHGGGRGERRSFSASFDAFPPGTREAQLRIDGPLGSWRLPFELVPRTGVPSATPLDVSTEDAGITLAAIGRALGPDYTAVRVAATAVPPVQRIDGLAGDPGAPMPSIVASGERLELRQHLGTRHFGTTLEDTLLFRALPPDARDVALRLGRVVVEEDAEPCPITFPSAIGDYRFGRFPLRVRSARADSSQRGEPIVALDCDVEAVDGRWLRRLSADVDGESALAGLSWGAAVPLGLSILHPGYEPFTMTLRHPVVETNGRWELPFRI